jgi:hypothetical protein
MRPNATEQTQHDPRRPAEELVGLPKVLQPLPPFHPPLLSHNILSLLAMLLLLQQVFCGHPLSSGRPRRLAYKVRFFRFA